MPMTRSEAMFFTAGLVIGAAAGANYPLLKEKLGPLLSGALPVPARPSANPMRKWPRRWPRRWKPYRTRWPR